MASEDYKKRLDKFFQNRELMLHLIPEIADELDEVHKNVKITKVVTGSTGIAGAILCVTGLALAIPTAGLSMFLTIGGGVLAATSGASHLGSDIAERWVTKERLDKFNELCQADEANVDRLNEYFKKKSEKLQDIDTGSLVRETGSSVAGQISSISNLTCSIIRISQAATLTVNTIRIIGVTGIALSTVFLPIQVIDLTANGIALHKKEGSETSIKLRELAAELQLQVDNIKKYIENLELQTNVE